MSLFELSKMKRATRNPKNVTAHRTTTKTLEESKDTSRTSEVRNRKAAKARKQWSAKKTKIRYAILIRLLMCPKAWLGIMWWILMAALVASQPPVNCFHTSCVGFWHRTIFSWQGFPVDKLNLSFLSDHEATSLVRNGMSITTTCCVLVACLAELGVLIPTV